MPRTAQTSNKRSRSRSRFQQRQDASRTPVLFRLPEVEVGPEVAASEEAAEESDFSSEDIPSPDDSKPKALRAKVAKSAASPETETSSEPVAVSPALQTQPEEEVGSSWWEHWSSGVVLILLIIALVTASIIAFNDSGTTDPSLLAENGSENQTGDPEWGEIEIPDIEEGIRVEELAQDSAPAKSLPNLEEQFTAQEEVVPDPQFSPTLAADASESPEALGLNPEQLELATSDLSTALNEATSETLEPLGLLPDMDGGLTFADEPQQNNVPTQPVSVATPAPEESAETTEPQVGSPQSSEAELNVAMQQGAGSQLLPPVNQSQQGPLTIDLTKPSQAVAGSPGVPPATPSTGTANSTGLPSYNSVLNLPNGQRADSTPMHTVAGEAGGARMQTSGHRTQVVEPSSEKPVVQNGIRRTTTPDMDAGAIIRAYKFFDELTNSSETSDSSNRYSGEGQ